MLFRALFSRSSCLVPLQTISVSIGTPSGNSMLLIERSRNFARYDLQVVGITTEISGRSGVIRRLELRSGTGALGRITIFLSDISARF